MADKHSKESRSYNMSRVKNKNTKVEILLRKALWAENIRFRLHSKNMPGKPDIVINKYKLVIFVDGGFWHGYNWKLQKMKIKSNTNFWISKIEKNISRDLANQKALEEAGYVVMRFWDHDIKKNLSKCVNQVCLYLESTKVDTIPQLM